MSQIGSIELIAKIDTSKYKQGAGDINKANKDMETSSDGAEKSTQKTDNALLGMSKRGLKFAAAGMTALGATVAGLTIKGGIERALNIEDARASLKGLGHDTKIIETIMDSALKSVRGTAFGLGDAATIAATAVAAGVKPGEKLTSTLKLTANAAALARVGLNEMGSILNKVWTNGKVSTEELNQLADRGIPIWTKLAEHYKVSGEELRKMVSSGKVDAESFATVLEKTVGNAAVEMGKTTRGSWQNMLAALSRIGEKIVSGPIASTRTAFGSITAWLDNNSSKIVGIVNGTIETLTNLGSKVSSVFSSISSDVQAGSFGSLGEKIGSKIASGLNAAILGLSVSIESAAKWFSGVDWLKLGIEVGKKAVGFIIGFGIGILGTDPGPLIKSLADNWQAVLVAGLTIAFAPAKVIGVLTKIIGKIPILGPLTNSIIKGIRSLTPLARYEITRFFTSVGGVVKSGISRVGTIFSTVGQIIKGLTQVVDEQLALLIRFIPETIQKTFSGVVGILQWFTAIVKNILGGLFNIITTILRPLTAFFSNMFSGIWQAIQGIFSGTGNFFAMKFLQARLLVQEVFGGIVNWFLGRWIAIQNIFGNVAEWFRGRFALAWELIKGVFSGVGNFFSGVWNTIVGKFGNVGTAVGNALGNAFKNVINSVLRGAGNIINGFIDALNGAVGAINKVPGVNIGKIGRLNIPQLAEGGIVSSATLALIGEGREPEAVIPLSKLDNMLSGDGAGKIEYNIENINIYKEVDGEYWLQRLTQNQEIISNGLVPKQRYT